MLELSGIVAESIVDGPGIRTTVFAQGCPHRCDGCHNPQTWEFGCGPIVEEETVVAAVTSNPLCKGVTFSGGEPFAQPEGFARLAKLLKARGYEVASYSGYTFEQLLAGTQGQKTLLKAIDVLIDGPFVQQEKSLELYFRGSRNQRILDGPRSLEQGRAVECEDPRWTGNE